MVDSAIVLNLLLRRSPPLTNCKPLASIQRITDRFHRNRFLAAALRPLEIAVAVEWPIFSFYAAGGHRFEPSSIIQTRRGQRMARGRLLERKSIRFMT